MEETQATTTPAILIEKLDKLDAHLEDNISHMSGQAHARERTRVCKTMLASISMRAHVLTPFGTADLNRKIADLQGRLEYAERVAREWRVKAKTLEDAASNPDLPDTSPPKEIEKADPIKAAKPAEDKPEAGKTSANQQPVKTVDVKPATKT